MATSAVLQEDLLATTRQAIECSLAEHGIAILPPIDAIDSLRLLTRLDLTTAVTMLDPWYNKGVGGVRSDYREAMVALLRRAGEVSSHTFFWGFPEIAAGFVEYIPPPLVLVAWLTWYYKNSPSVVRGWRSSQMTCLHLSHPGARLYPEHFLNAAQLDKLAAGKLRYMPGPTSVIQEPLPLAEDNTLSSQSDVIEESLLVGFVGRKEQTGHPAQKPVAVFQRLLLMTTQPGDLVVDPMCGSGTTGVAARSLGLRAILSDHSPEYIELASKRLGVAPIAIDPAILLELTPGD